MEVNGNTVDIKECVNYSEDDVIGVHQDFFEGIIKNLKDNTHFNFTMLPNAKKCTVDANMNIIAFEGDENYTDDGSNGTAVWYIPKFYNKVIPLSYREYGSDEYAVTQLKECNYLISSVPKDGLVLHNAFRDLYGDEIDYILMSLDGKIYDFEFEKWLETQEDVIKYYVFRGNAIAVRCGQPPYEEISQGTYPTFEALPSPDDEDRFKRPRLGFIYYVCKTDETGISDAKRYYLDGTAYIRWLREE